MWYLIQSPFWVPCLPHRLYLLDLKGINTQNCLLSCVIRFYWPSLLHFYLCPNLSWFERLSWLHCYIRNGLISDSQGSGVKEIKQKADRPTALVSLIACFIHFPLQHLHWKKASYQCDSTDAHQSFWHDWSTKGQQFQGYCYYWPVSWTIWRSK